ncbi:fatty acid synthase-like, partial [Aplysia californica]|uniref:Fatty acid synthase-like n=1 Tax=Aplysia californica TaxID=6500 RepID=A0ABM1VSF7_APLCA
MYLLRKKQKIPINPTFIHMEGLECSWLEDIQKEMALLEAEPADSGKRLWLVSETMNSGVVGFVQCLRREPGGDKVRFA